MTHPQPRSERSSATVAGVLLRGFRGTEDFAPMIAVREGSLAHDGLDPLSPRDPLPSVDDMAHWFADTPPGDPSVLLAEHAKTLVGWARTSHWTEEGDIAVFLHLEYLLPAWRGKGIGAAMLRWAEERLKAQAAELVPSGTTVLATNAAATEREKTAAILALGYEPVRWLCEMRAGDLDPLPTSTLPEDVAMRPAEPGHLPAIYAMLRNAWAGRFGTLAEGDEAYQDWLDSVARVPDAALDLWRVAWHGDEVVGLVVGRISRGHGYLDEVATHTSWQRRGIARALLVAVLRAIHERGVNFAHLYTDARDGQGARTLYERAGFRATTEHVLYRKPLLAGQGIIPDNWQSPF